MKGLPFHDAFLIASTWNCVIRFESSISIVLGWQLSLANCVANTKMLDCSRNLEIIIHASKNKAYSKNCIVGVR